MDGTLDRVVGSYNINEIKTEKISSLPFLPPEEFTQEYFRVKAAKRPHEVLGLPENATPEQVREAHRRLVKILHPDRLNDPNWEELANIAVAKVTEAYEYYQKMQIR